LGEKRAGCAVRREEYPEEREGEAGWVIAGYMLQDLQERGGWRRRFHHRG